MLFKYYSLSVYNHLTIRIDILTVGSCNMDFEEEDTYLYLKVSDNDSLQESIAERIEDAVSKIKYNDNYIEIELKFGRIISNKTKNKRIQFDDDNDESFIVQAKNFDYFDSNIGRRHWRKINNYVRNDFG